MDAQAHPQKTALDPMLAHWQAQTQARQAQQLYRQTRVRTGAASSAQLFCSNDYLGLAQHPDLAAALAQGAKEHGAVIAGEVDQTRFLNQPAELDQMVSAFTAFHSPCPHVGTCLDRLSPSTSRQRPPLGQRCRR